MWESNRDTESQGKGSDLGISDIYSQGMGLARRESSTSHRPEMYESIGSNSPFAGTDTVSAYTSTCVRENGAAGGGQSGSGAPDVPCKWRSSASLNSQSSQSHEHSPSPQSLVTDSASMHYACPGCATGRCLAHASLDTTPGQQPQNTTGVFSRAIAATACAYLLIRMQHHSSIQHLYTI